VVAFNRSDALTAAAVVQRVAAVLLPYTAVLASCCTGS
jgi:hypothetical protein